MKTKKCMWCLKEFEIDSNEKYCSIECKDKSNSLADKSNKGKTREGILGGIVDAISSLFS
ncbi:MAG: hypothetical protein AB7O47_03610 [Flavobacteriales bacterium]